MSDFASCWAFPSEIRDSLREPDGEPISYEVRATGAKFRTGREKWECVFHTPNGTISVHDAMELTSKRSGKEYYMVRRTPQAAKHTLADV